jgi:hypothetical protein
MAAWVALVTLHVLLVANVLLLAWPIEGRLAAFCALAALALAALLAVPLLAARARRSAVAA